MIIGLGLNTLKYKKRIALLTDSCADLSPELQKGKAIYVVPLKMICTDGEYADGETIFAEDIYRRLQAGEFPRTSLPDGGVVSDTLDRIYADGYRNVIAVMLSGALSGTYNMIRIQSEQRTDMEIAVFDSRNGALGIGIIVLQLWQEILDGADWEELTEKRVPWLIEHTYPFFTVDTLEYLYRGGRIGRITALAGSMLQIKPTITFSEDGQLKTAAKVRGRRQLQGKLIELLKSKYQPGDRYNIAVANGGAPHEMEQLMREMQKTFPDYEQCWHGELDATLSVYLGSGVVGGGIQILGQNEG